MDAKPNRRGFLGLFAGAAAAGPKLAAGLAEQAISGGMPLMPSMGSSELVASACDEGWKASRIAGLKAIITGQDPRAKRDRVMHRLYMAESLEKFRLDGLRSVSATHKMQMLLNGSPSRQERVRKADAGFELADLLKPKLPF